MSKRDPLPYPRYQNDDDFLGKSTGRRSCNSSGGSGELDLSGNEDTLRLQPGEQLPWDRLNSTKTLSSMRREVYYHDPIAPNDKLDFALRVEYDHHHHCLWSKAESVLLPETARPESEHGRTMKNREKWVEPVTLETKELVSNTARRKDTLDCAKGLAIEGHHSEATNRGYSRKKDGGFYTT